MGRNSVAHCHRRVTDVAREAAAELYEGTMRDNLVRGAWKAQHPGLSEAGLLAAFVKRFWPGCIPFARATMARLLAAPTIDPSLKEEIMDALALDNTLLRGRANPKEVLGEIPNG